MATRDVVLLHNAAEASGRGRVLFVDGSVEEVVGIQIPTAGTGQVDFEGSLDGGTWFRIEATNLLTNTAATFATASGIYRVEAAGLGAISCPLTRASGAWTVQALPQRAS